MVLKRGGGVAATQFPKRKGWRGGERRLDRKAERKEENDRL